MAGVASALIVLVTILKLGPLFQELPKVFVIFLASVSNRANGKIDSVCLFCLFVCFPHLHRYRVDEVFYNVCMCVCFRLFFRLLSL